MQLFKVPIGIKTARMRILRGIFVDEKSMKTGD
jgi:hypothetical protein